MSDINVERRTSWVCHVTPDRTVRLEDIPARTLGDLEQRFATSWLRLVSRPMDFDNPNVEQTIAMYERCCTLAGVESRDLTVRELTDKFELVEDDRPDRYDGGLPAPLAGETTTVG